MNTFLSYSEKRGVNLGVRITSGGMVLGHFSFLDFRFLFLISSVPDLRQAAFLPPESLSTATYQWAVSNG